jgi:hypothetical protein
MCGLAEVLSPQITKKIGSANRKSVKCHVYGRSTNLANYFSPQTGGTFLLTAHLCNLYKCGNILGEDGLANYISHLSSV